MIQFSYKIRFSVLFAIVAFKSEKKQRTNAQNVFKEEAKRSTIAIAKLGEGYQYGEQ